MMNDRSILLDRENGANNYSSNNIRNRGEALKSTPKLEKDGPDMVNKRQGFMEVLCHGAKVRSCLTFEGTCSGACTPAIPDPQEAEAGGLQV